LAGPAFGLTKPMSTRRPKHHEVALVSIKGIEAHRLRCAVRVGASTTRSGSTRAHRTGRSRAAPDPAQQPVQALSRPFEIKLRPRMANLLRICEDIRR
jgi:hypothetical protein